ncbi:high mobility group box domain-containing protein, partial [Fennellomyces sp. T-0311]
RPVNCFLAYRLEKQKLITTVCPGVNHREISKAVARWWSEEPEYEKEKYRQLAELDKQRHKEKYPNYKYCPKKKRPSNA